MFDGVSSVCSEYLGLAKSKLKDGDCKLAQRCYNVYKKLSKKTDSSVDGQVQKCNGGTSTESSVRKDYTETAFGINMKIIWVDGGDILIGCSLESVNDTFDYDKNVRRITVDDFYIGMLEVSRSQWETVVGTTIYQQRNKFNYCLIPPRLILGELTVCKVYDENNKDVGVAMLKAGLAHHFRRYDDSAEYERYEVEACEQKRGL